MSLLPINVKVSRISMALKAWVHSLKVIYSINLGKIGIFRSLMRMI